MTLKKIISIVASTAILCAAVSSISFSVSAESGDIAAVATICGQFGTYNYWNENSNTGNVTAETANIDGNATYQTTLNLSGDGADSIEFLFLQIMGADSSIPFNSENLKITIDRIYIDGGRYNFSDNDKAYQLSWKEGVPHARIFFADEWGINGGECLGLAPINGVKSQIKVIFTVSGLDNAGTSNIPAEPEYKMGDVNNSGGTPDSDDASMVLAEYARQATDKPLLFSDGQRIAADVNKDGSVNSDDASYILAYYAASATGKTPSWPV